MARGLAQMTDAAVWSGLRKKKLVLRQLVQFHGPAVLAHGRNALAEANELSKICTMLCQLIKKTPNQKIFK